MLKMIENFKQKLRVRKENKLISRLNKKVSKISKRVNKLQIKNFNIAYTISRDYKRYRFTYSAPVIFQNTKDEIIKEIFGNKKYKEQFLEGNSTLFYSYNVELVLGITKKEMM